ncbi:hypothetical protein [Dysgonomonas sp. BGC7]|uniref:hypothetical protein n=1 Tax=Dysgonomonas sp. BGC7 TaxID=1658008 RepID=UPI000680A253|nr:hypothetical protein [Dysgonomonas sp. BGC7]MBD8389619.1 hypothetical protein [Dysgonomonas sp. BGC7]
MKKLLLLLLTLSFFACSKDEDNDNANEPIKTFKDEILGRWERYDEIFGRKGLDFRGYSTVYQYVYEGIPEVGNQGRTGTYIITKDSLFITHTDYFRNRKYGYSIDKNVLILTDDPLTYKYIKYN